MDELENHHLEPIITITAAWDRTEPPAPPFDEPIYTVKEVGELLGLSDNAVIKLFEHEPGVRDLAEALYFGKRRRMLRIPHSVLERVWNRSEIQLTKK